MNEADAPFRPDPAGWAARGIVGGLVVWVVLFYPINLFSPFHVSGPEANAAAEAVIFAVIGLSLNVLIGYAGTISLGHQAFVGMGAFTSAYVVSQLNQEFYAGLVVAALLGGLQAILLGLVSLRISGLYFSLITLSYGVMAQASLFQINSLTGGTAGQPAPRPTGFESDYRYYILCVAGLGIVLWLDWRLTRSKGGRALLALRENPRVAASMGINVRGATLLAFGVAGVFAGIGGSLLAHRDLSVTATPFEFRLALVFVIMTVVGGLRNRTGVVVGAAFFSLLGSGEILQILHVEHLLADRLDLNADVAPLVIGPLLLILTLTMNPGGIGQQLAPVRDWLRGKRFDIHAGETHEVQVTDVRA